MDHPILEQLRVDHVNVGRVIEVATHELDQLAVGGEADYSLLEDALRYLTGYSDVHHHPVEDIVYFELAKAFPEVADDLARIVSQHETLVRQGHAFLDQVSAVEEAAIVRRDRFVEAGRNYLESLDRHMRIEEQTLFPAAAERLGAEHWARIETRFKLAPDPLFGPDVEQRYRNLLDRTTAEALRGRDRSRTPGRT